MNTKFIVYCDMDSVIVNFHDPVLNLINYSLYKKEIFCEEEKNMARRLRQMYEFKQITAYELRLEDGRNPYLISFMTRLLKNNISIWNTLPWMKDGRKLWSFLIMNYKNVRILSAPARGAETASIIGKRQWIKKEIGYDLDKCYFYRKKHIFASKDSILIDDREDNISNWRQYGGKGILHKNSDLTILTLNNFFL